MRGRITSAASYKEFITDKETALKPKTELIKKPKESSLAESQPERSARKFSGKNASKKAGGKETELGAEDAAPVNEEETKPRKKVVIVRKKGTNPKEAGGVLSETDDTPPANEGTPASNEAAVVPAPHTVKPVESAAAPALPETAVEAKTNTPQTGNVAAAQKPPQAEPVKPATPWTISQRPAVQAGKVGGRYVNSRDPKDGSFKPRSFGDRPHGLRTGTGPGTGGGNYRWGENRPYGQRPPFNNGQRPPFNNGQPGGPRGMRGSSAGGFTPGSRPGGFAGKLPLRAGAAAPSVPVVDNKGAVKRSFKAKKSVYQRKDKEIEMEEKLRLSKKRAVQTANPVPKSIDIMEIVTVSELARKMNLKASDLIQKLMSMGQMVSINQQIDSDTASILAAEFGADVNIVNLYAETLIETGVDDENDMSPRPPVVTVMGHVDHGKTKLLDAIRSADVASGEFGGITQHIGAYMVETQHGSITFLDTPGHEAFTRMRSRGAQVTDIVVLVVAADDGVMPQTIEAINHAKEADVPIIVAVNKIDKAETNIDKVKSQLSELGLQPEEWGGQTIFVPISALKKEGIDNLVDAILLQAEILDLKADYNRRAEGKILESRIDQGRGIVASILVEKGTLEVGDSFVAGIWPGKVRALFNDKGIKVGCATASMPVEVLGFEGIPNAGDPLQVVEDEKTARSYSTKRQELKRFEDAKNIKKITLDNLYDTISDGSVAELKVIIKGDVQGSVEALKSSLEKLSTREVRLSVIQALPGAINEGDVDLAIASNAILIGFNVRPTPKAKALAEQEKVDIRKYNIIYRVVEEMQQAMEGLLRPDKKEEVIASVEVRKVFKISKAGIIAGCFVQSGTVKRGASVNIIRDNIVVFTGKLVSLRRIKDDVKEVSAGYECGISIEGFEDLREGDQFEVFEIIEIARKLGET